MGAAHLADINQRLQAAHNSSRPNPIISSRHPFFILFFIFIYSSLSLSLYTSLSHSTPKSHMHSSYYYYMLDIYCTLDYIRRDGRQLIQTHLDHSSSWRCYQVDMRNVYRHRLCVYTHTHTQQKHISSLLFTRDFD